VEAIVEARDFGGYNKEVFPKAGGKSGWENTIRGGAPITHIWGLTPPGGEKTPRGGQTPSELEEHQPPPGVLV